MATGALSIKLRCASWPQLGTIYRRDLSRGTMFLKASAPPPIGTMVRIDLTLPSASVIVLTGVVNLHVDDPQRGVGVELKLAPIPTGSIWLIESALAADSKQRAATPAAGVPQVVPPMVSAPIPVITDGEALTEAESDLIRALVAEAESLKKLNPFLVLGVGYEASDADVRAAFGELTKRYHPDRFARYESTELRQVAAEIFILIRDAYRRLGDATARASALQTLGRSTPPPRAVPAPRQANELMRVVTPPLGVPRIATPAGGVARITPAGGVPKIAAPAPRGASQKIPTAHVPPLPPPPPSVAAIPNAAAASDATDANAADALIDAGRLAEALAAYKALVRKQPTDRTVRAGVELCEGLTALGQRDRLEAAQRFEAALEIDPSNERAARELADMRRQATHERKGLLSRLMGKKEP